VFCLNVIAVIDVCISSIAEQGIGLYVKCGRVPSKYCKMSLMKLLSNWRYGSIICKVYIKLAVEIICDAA